MYIAIKTFCLISCKKKYLPVSDGCVHENVIIGATVGVVGAVLLGLVIAALVLCCKLDKKKQYKTYGQRFIFILSTFSINYFVF